MEDQRQHWNYRKCHFCFLWNQAFTGDFFIGAGLPGSGHWSHLVCEVIEDSGRLTIHCREARAVLVTVQSRELFNKCTKKLPIIRAELFVAIVTFVWSMVIS
jgi:hypothetical protein